MPGLKPEWLTTPTLGLHASRFRVLGFRGLCLARKPVNGKLVGVISEPYRQSRNLAAIAHQEFNNLGRWYSYYSPATLSLYGTAERD